MVPSRDVHPRNPSGIVLQPPSTTIYDDAPAPAIVLRGQICVVYIMHSTEMRARSPFQKSFPYAIKRLTTSVLPVASSCHYFSP